MTPKNLTRKFYDQSPYPPPADRKARRWHLPPLEWILAMDRARKPLPRRVLAAGCGTGSEAFHLQKALKDAEIVAVDFSGRSIREARKAQAGVPLAKRVRFIQADLADPGLERKAGGDFDLIVCHGVLTYIPRPDLTLRNLARCLRADGMLYLGVNGAGHFSAALRPVLAKLGFEVNVMPPDERWRCLIKMWDEGNEDTEKGLLTRLPGWYLGSDFFGPVFHNFSLTQWSKMFHRAGLFLRASFDSHRALRPMVSSEAARLFMGCPRAAVCEVLDTMHPASFHQLILTRQPPPLPPWEHTAKLLDWRPARTGLYSISRPRPGRRIHSSAVVSLKSPALRTQFEWPMPPWESELLHRCDGTRTIRQLLRETGGQAAFTDLGEQLFLLYQFAVVNLFPP